MVLQHLFYVYVHEMRTKCNEEAVGPIMENRYIDQLEKNE